MSQKDNFGGGFVIGSLVGGLVGGLLGALLATRDETVESSEKLNLGGGEAPLDISSEESIEKARHSLEDKISQLNVAIDEVRRQLESVDSGATQDSFTAENGSDLN
ncbi:MAG: hypothetical protein AAFY16_13555 [Cyanobacteria bacterium J06642_3]